MADSKYLNLDEAAARLGISADDLKRLREKGDIRGFADRGTWKFKVDDVQDLVRRRTADSDPEVRLADLGDGNTPDSESNFLLESDSFDMEGDSDVRLMGSNDSFDLVSESDVKLVGNESKPPGKGKDPGSEPLMPASGSDVKLVGSDSDSDVKLIGGGSDSDVKLVDDDSDSDVKLVDPATSLDVKLQSGGKDDNLLLDDDGASDVQLLKSGSGLFSGGDLTSALDEAASDDEPTMGGDSSMQLQGASIPISGKSPTPKPPVDEDDDEGITLSLNEDSGISLDMGDSGISLESVGDSGISLEEDTFAGTVPMMDALSDDNVPATQFEIPSLKGESAYDLDLDDSGADTGVLELQSAGDSGDLDDAVFDVDDDASGADAAEADEDLEMEEAAFEDDDQAGVFDAADDDVFGADEGDEFAPRAGGRRMAFGEVEWDSMTVGLLSCSAVIMLLLGSVMLDLVANTATSAAPSPVSGPLISALGGLFGG